MELALEYIRHLSYAHWAQGVLFGLDCQCVGLDVSNFVGFPFENGKGSTDGSCIDPYWRVGER